MKKYREDILVFVFFVITTSAIILTRNLNNLDEVWIFNTARNIANGLLPYKDFNLVTTPGLPIFCGMILKIFGTEMFIMRIMAIITNSFIMFIIYKILKTFKIKKEFSLIISIIIMKLLIESMCIDYNFIILLIALITLYIELKTYKKSNNIFEYNLRKEILLGILAGLSITMKQTTGICFVIAFIGYKLLAVRNKEDLKLFLKIAVTRFLVCMLPVIILLIYLLCNNIMNEFIDYAILGIKDFSNSISYLNLLKGKLSILAILVPITIIISLYISIRKNNQIITILFAYSVSTIVVVYPISDNVHFLIAGTITIITGIYLLKELYENKFKGILEKSIIIWIENFIKALIIILILIMVGVSIYRLINYTINFKEYKNLENFKYIPVSKELEEHIIKVDKYLEEQQNDVYIVDARAAIYMIPINRYNKNYDMFLKGNIGGKGSKGIIEDLQSKENITLLILKDKRSLNWQTPIDIIEYVQNKYEKIGEIEGFEIWK